MGNDQRLTGGFHSDGDTVRIGVTSDVEALDIQDNHVADSEENAASRLDTTVVDGGTGLTKYEHRHSVYI